MKLSSGHRESFRTTYQPPLAKLALGALPADQIPEEVLEMLGANEVLSHAPISRYKVSVVAQTAGYPLVPGVNIEFPGTTLNETMHAEQAVIAVAHARGMPALETIYIACGAAPCGHCRQALNELGTDPVIWAKGESPRTLSYYLPQAFGPKDLGIPYGLLNSSIVPVTFKFGANDVDDASACALRAASRSYAPYSKAYAGIALTLNDGMLVHGSYLENVAMNPSLSPFHSALANLVAEHRRSVREISRVTLAAVESDLIDHVAPIRRLSTALGIDCAIEERPLILA